MTKTSWMLAAIVAATGAAAPAFAQDSVSTNPNGGDGLPGDALDPWALGQQCASYVVDLTPFQSSKGNAFAIAPIVKASKISPNFFSSLVSSQGISNSQLSGVPFASAGYLAWTMPGQGVHPVNNSGGMNVAPTGASNQFAVGFSEFGSSPSRVNNAIGALVNYMPSNPGSLFVKRVSAATNVPSAAAGDFAQFGFGAVDSNGNLYFRGDANGSTGLPTTSRLGGGTANQNNIFRVEMASRNCGATNMISEAGGADASATDRVVTNQTLAHNTPNCIPQSIATRPVYIGSRFGATGMPGAYRHESAPLTVSETTAHLTAAATDHRGNVGFSRFPLFSGSVATASILGKSTMRAGGPTDSMIVWGVDANGAVTTSRVLVAPNSVSDSCDAFTVNQNWANGEFDGYHGATAFRGGNGMVAVGRDQAGRALVAATLYDGITVGADNPCNHIVVARFDPSIPGSTIEWRLAAWFDCNSVVGKPIWGPSGSPVGELAALVQVTGGSPQGPSISAPAFDAVGNLYFIAAVKQYATKTTPESFDTALVRAVYDPANFCYELEMIFDNGDVFMGQNSGREYQIQFLQIASQGGGLNSGSFFSNNVMQTGWGNTDVANLMPEDPNTLGGLVFQAGIVYDTNGDGLFRDPTGAGGTAGSPDEAYNVLMFVGSGADVGAPCPADLNGDGSVSAADLALMLGAWGPCPGCPADLNNDGSVSAADLALMLGAWGPCP